MKLIAIALTCIAISLVVISCTETAPTTTPTTPTSSASPAKPVDEFAAARLNYQKHCESCHGDKGEGGLVKVDNKQIKVASLKAEHAIKKPDDKIVKIITAGEEEMPAFKDKMTGEEITQMMRFVRKQFQGK